MFPSLATMKTMLTSFQCFSLKIFLSSGEGTTMAHSDVEVEEPQANLEKGYKRNGIGRKGDRVTHCLERGQNLLRDIA